MPTNDSFTKIIATIGPASESEKTLEQLLLAGVDVFRLNMKHNTHEWYANTIKKIRKISENHGVNTAIMADFQGPELRTGIFPNGIEKIVLKSGQTVVLSKTPKDKKHIFIPFDFVHSIKGLQPKHKIYLDDGRVELEVEKVTQASIYAKVLFGNALGLRKSVSIPQANILMPTLTEKDKKDLKFSVEHNVDFVALSFVRDRQDIATLKKKIKSLGGHQHIVAKIETLKAIENFDEILDETDVIMVARGDLGVEVSMERLPRIQKHMIERCREEAKPVIVATQMLKSMVSSYMPTRAEVADIANAVFDKTDALMLSEETATGKYPVRAVSTMSKIARFNEQQQFAQDIVKLPESFEEIIITASIEFVNKQPSNEKEVQGYIVFTESGMSARILSRFRPPIPVFAFTEHSTVARQLAMSYGVQAFRMKLSSNPNTNTKNAIDFLKRKHLVLKGEKIIAIFGNNVGTIGANNNLSIVDVV